MRTNRPSDYHLSSADLARVVYRGPKQGRHRWRDRCLLKLLAQSGLRRFEVSALDIRDLDFPTRRLHVREGKGGKSRIVPLSEDLAGDLEQLVGMRRRGPVFLSDRGRTVSIRQISRLVAEAGFRARVKNPDPDSGGMLG